ncbi:sigma-70 family RNA polymerase sigma factor [Streptomyces sp. S3(2020)]|uniref:sigma-70 family RNA polymerase sigma factor n=1 Tax=Streptomyces sp. S3(2020) TaxID=2732044 RepID=UPI001489F001|nr:sigma-70 family RNA polymerase sigma factor [Streptomyces sp. S3(2020)]NNN37695.1 sigma-70 family RNA polymerase sigma factor [Streptomyces sp. S3(2020)]
MSPTQHKPEEHPESPHPDGGQAFARVIYQTHGTALLQFAQGLTLGDVHGAEDIVQEAVLRAWRHADRLTSTPGLTRPWLFTVVRRLAIDAHRTRKARPVDLIPAALDHEVVSDSSERTLTAQVLLRALTELDRPHREVLVHRYCLDRSIEDTAAELNLPAGTVKSRSSHALRALRRALTSLGATTPAGLR